MINEVLPNPDEGEAEWVELYNPTPQNIDVSGAWIDDAAAGRAPFQLPTGSVVPANGYLTFDFTRVFNNDGDSVRLFDRDGSTVVDSFVYVTSARGDSWARVTGGGNWQATPDATPSKGGAN